MVSKYMKNSSTSLGIKEMQTKSRLILQLILVRMSIITNKTYSNAGKGAGKRNSYSLLGRNEI
jgi:hypothetical protein